MNKIAIILGSTRPGRKGEPVARWVHEVASKRNDAEYELVDIADYGLPLLDEPMPPIMGQYEFPYTKAWSDKIASFDGYVFVTPTYNRATSGALKNAIDYLHKEWNNKAAGLIAYGGADGISAIDNLRLILSELRIAHVRTQLSFSLHTDFENYSVFKPTPYHEEKLHLILDEVLAWSAAMKTVRATATA
ncbi:FMN reductase [Cohnella xylanilytica]|uniref:NAD(P)H-dependent oxidoreductase n=1 Tax=Cohnella xylanilytica TaxID=557555 RepID=A0A841TV06_9BACL|nr:NAD(P)H-dependent oxidoreductase [Cohnella xylanilytica]MBB6690003.1 NAD(P)H-dependent oxidoreductase [Cohnella xylanilytica]GIO16650.1 FMN reductase [Cohnella xylanilytica]